ncbi:MAG: hypothetical protein HN341_03585 [Verrucomicrobia bacterium]|nr:hypothetical protein [Verrucomicrobiota bacterium]
MKAIVTFHLLFAVLLLAGCADRPAGFHVSGVAPEHRHANALVENAFCYTDPAHGLIDSASGYPVEGWNHDPKQGLYLRGFTQLTAIGEWIELLACIAAGQADNPYRSSKQALEELDHVVATLLADQADPGLSAKGLLSNFVGFSGNRRLGPLGEHVKRVEFEEQFGTNLGVRIWHDLEECGWLEYEKDGAEAQVKRSAEYGRDHFKGVLKSYADQGLTDAIMQLLDARVVNIIFGDNVNLTASIAKAAGALLDPSLKRNAEAAQLVALMEAFIEKQREGYHHLYDKKAGSFAFGWNATEDILTGWELDDGSWVVGRMNYLINEFRGGWTFVVERHGFPATALRSGGFKLRPYTAEDGRELYVPIAWDGSAFQMLGLSHFMQELEQPGWRALLSNAVQVELDYATRHGLPGFLSESYSGDEAQYTGAVGIPELAVTKEERITDAPSLYTLGVAYQIEPAAVEAFLGKNWSTIEKLLTDHGPWEGYKTSTDAVIEFQTTAHTLSLILGFVGTGHENMKRYLDFKGLGQRRRQAAPGEGDLLSGAYSIYSGGDGDPRVKLDAGKFEVDALSGSAWVAFQATSSDGVDLAGATLLLEYQADHAISDSKLELKLVPGLTGAVNEIALNLEATGPGGRAIAIPLPETPGLTGVGEIVLMLGRPASDTTASLVVSRFEAQR